MDFNTVAAQWDTELRVERARRIAQEISKEILPEQKGNALEFGCGTGLISCNLIQEFKHITGVDVTENMIAIFNEKIQQLEIPNVTAMTGDILTWATEDKFDFIFSSMALHHIKDIDGCLRVLYSLLKPGGKLCIVDLDEEDGSFHSHEPGFDGHNGFNQERLREQFATKGFQKVSSHDFYNIIKRDGDVDRNYSLFLISGIKK